MKLEQSIIILRPIDEVFAYLSAVGRTAEWKPGVRACEPSSSSDCGVGSRWTEERRGSNGISEEWELEITECRPNSEIDTVGRCGAVRVAEHHSLVPWDDHTRVTLSVEMTGGVRGAMSIRTIVENLIHLKWQIEQVGGSSAVSAR